MGDENWLDLAFYFSKRIKHALQTCMQEARSVQVHTLSPDVEQSVFKGFTIFVYLNTEGLSTFFAR